MSVGSYICKRCRSLYTRHVENLSSIADHVRFEADLSVEERSHIANFGKILLDGFFLNILVPREVLCLIFLDMMSKIFPSPSERFFVVKIETSVPSVAGVLPSLTSISV